jgi:hypothetical protein
MNPSFRNYTTLVAVVAGVLIGFFTCKWLFVPKVQTVVEYRETIKTDTVFVPVKEFVTVTDIRHRVIRDTVLIDTYKPRIQAFSGTFPFTYGNAYLTGEVLGEVLRADLRTDFKMPVITNTITKEKTTTTTIIQKGLFVGGGINSAQEFHVGAAYLGKNFMIGYDFQPGIQSHQIGFKHKIM